RCAPAGIETDAEGPRATTRPPATTRVPLSIGARPVPSMILAFVNATAPPVGTCWADDGGDASVTNASSVPVMSAESLRVVRIMTTDLRKLHKPRSHESHEEHEIQLIWLLRALRSLRVLVVDIVPFVVQEAPYSFSSQRSPSAVAARGTAS